jgi:uracil-DNA glycosylase
MRTVLIEPTFESWRDSARRLLAQRVEPAEVLWSDDPAECSLFGEEENAAPAQPSPKVPAAFLEMARSAAAHTDPRRWGILYHLLWRITHGGEKWLLTNAVDPEIRLVQHWCKHVGRSIHKMHAFVRFRLAGTNEESGREQFVAWFEPEHRIMRLGTPFFVKRFHNMDWSILTPDECAHWDGKSLIFTAGVTQENAPKDDALEDLWRSYYRSIFNPARLKTKAMQSEMPKKYWKNLPEASLIECLISESRKRVDQMFETEERPVKAAPKNAYLARLKQLNQERESTGCDE